MTKAPKNMEPQFPDGKEPPEWLDRLRNGLLGGNEPEWLDRLRNGRGEFEWKYPSLSLKDVDWVEKLKLRQREWDRVWPRQAPAPEMLPVKRWLADEIERMRKSGWLQAFDGNKSAIARDIKPRMKDAADRKEVERALSEKRIQALLKDQHQL